MDKREQDRSASPYYNTSFPIVRPPLPGTIFVFNFLHVETRNVARMEGRFRGGT